MLIQKGLMLASVGMEHTIHQHVLILMSVLLGNINVILMLFVTTFKIRESTHVLVSLVILAMVISVQKLTCVLKII